MTTKKNKNQRGCRNQSSKELHKSCFNCEKCQYIGEGDHLCEVSMTLVTDDWETTEDFYHCGGKEFVER